MVINDDHICNTYNMAWKAERDKAWNSPLNRQGPPFFIHFFSNT